MTDLELTSWIGVDSGGAFLLMFGHIDTSGATDVMSWAKVAPEGLTLARGIATYVDADTMEISSLNKTISNFIRGIDDGDCDWSISSDILTLEMNNVVVKIKME